MNASAMYCCLVITISTCSVASALLAKVEGSSNQRAQLIATNKRLASAPAPYKGPWHTSSGGARIPIPIGYQKERSRIGQMYLPVKRSGKMKIMVLFHGSGMDGTQMIDNFWWLADRYNIMLIAPESHNPMFWFAPTSSQPFTSDWYHVLAIIKWARAHAPGRQFDPKKFAFLGFSRGGYSAAAIASRFPEATHALVIHSSIDPKQFGNNKFPMWISTGNFDWMFTERRMNTDMNNFRYAKRGYTITFRIFPGTHTLQAPGERESAVKWFATTKGNKG